MKKVKIGVVVNKFAFITQSHVDMLRKACVENQVVIIAVGSSDRSRNTEIPFSYEERLRNVREVISNDQVLRNMTYRIIGLPDSPYNQVQWTNDIHTAVFNELETMNLRNYEDINVYVFRNNRYTYEDIFPSPTFNIISLKNNESYSFSDLITFHENGSRDGNLPTSFYDFLTEFVRTESFLKLVDEYAAIENMKNAWASSPFPPTFVTTDAVVYCKGHVLLVTRNAHVGNGQLCLPGGFLNQSTKVSDGIIENLKKDTAIKVSVPILKSNVTYTRVFDDPERSLRGRIITHAGIIVLDSVTSLQSLPQVREVKGQKNHAQWVPVHKINEYRNQFFEDHYYIIKTMLSSIDNT